MPADASSQRAVALSNLADVAGIQADMKTRVSWFSLFSILLLGQLQPQQAVAEALIATDAGGCSIGTLSDFSFAAIAIDTDRPATITGIQAWFDYVIEAGVVEAALYTDRDNRPGVHLVSEPFEVTHRGWNGLDDLDWMVEAGRYWIAFEVYDSPFVGSVGGTRNDRLVYSYRIPLTGCGSFVYDWVAGKRISCFGAQVDVEFDDS